MAYIAAPLWALLLLSTLAATALAPPPDYFPEPHQLFPTFPLDRTLQITALILGTVGLLILPKFAIWAEAVLTDRAEQFGGPKRALASMIAELILSSLMAPLMLMYQTRAVLQVLSGQDGGWPANARGEGILHVLESLRACYWIALFGGAAWLTVHHFAPELAPWILPLGIPMILAPLLIAWTSRPLTHKLFQSPEELNTPEIVDTYNEIRARWHIAPAAEPDAAPIPAVASHAEA
jgi:membrane glycosyltransferase